jgi:CBS domain-containing protein
MANRKLKDVMTKDPVTLGRSATLAEAAAVMRDRNIGAVVVSDNAGAPCGIVTDRDIVVRGLAAGAGQETPLDELCSMELAHLRPDDSVDVAVKLMAKKAIRRIPVMENGKVLGIVSIGDLAQAKDEKSALAGISAANPNR